MAPDADDIMTANDTIIVAGGPSSNDVAVPAGVPSSSDVIPATPPADIPPSSQVALPSTEDPGSPIDPSVSFKTEANDDCADAATIPSSLTPPPSTQALPAATAQQNSTHPASQRPALFSPPTTVPQTARRSTIVPAEYVPPTPQEVREAAPDALRAMMQDSIAENSRLKMETAHYKLQLNLASLQAGEDAKRAAVEHDMARREVEALRDGEHARQARRELGAATESARSKYLQARGMYEEAAGEVEHLERRLRLAKKVIQQQEDDICRLRDDRQQLRIRIRENREHFNMLCSPGGIFHGVLTPKGASQGRATPKGTPRQTQKPEATQHRFDALLQVLSQENGSAPSTPAPGKKPAARPPSKHTRNVQSLSSLPTTPTAPRNGAALLPSVHLAPRTEPRHVGGRRLLPDSPRREEEAEARSRESTISVPDDNAALARQALASVQKASSSLSRLSGAGRLEEGEEEEDVTQSQASAAASEMLRRDARGVEGGSEKRRVSEGREAGSPTKRARVQERLGLGIRY